MIKKFMHPDQIIKQNINIGDQEPDKEKGRFVFVNYPQKFAPMAFTAPSRYLKLEESFSYEPDKKEFSLVFDTGSVRPLANRELVLALVDKEVFSSEVAEVFLEREDIPQEELKQMIKTLYPDSVFAIESIVENREKELRSNISKIQGCYYKGKYYFWDDFSKLRKIFNEESPLALLGKASYVETGNYLYRAVDNREMENILAKGYYFIPDRTNFEKQVGLEVKKHQQKYRSGIIRIKAPGPYFKIGGMAVPRIESTTAMYAQEVEILHNNEWLSVEDYKRAVGDKSK